MVEPANKKISKMTLNILGNQKLGPETLEFTNEMVKAVLGRKGGAGLTHDLGTKAQVSRIQAFVFYQDSSQPIFGISQPIEAKVVKILIQQTPLLLNKNDVIEISSCHCIIQVVNINPDEFIDVNNQNLINIKLYKSNDTQGLTSLLKAEQKSANEKASIEFKFLNVINQDQTQSLQTDQSKSQEWVIGKNGQELLKLENNENLQPPFISDDNLAIIGYSSISPAHWYIKSPGNSSVKSKIYMLDYDEFTKSKTGESTKIFKVYQGMQLQFGECEYQVSLN